MNKTAFVAFIVGAAIGSVATWQYTKKKYEQIAQEEIDSVKEAYASKEVKKYDGPNDADEAKRKEQKIAATVAKEKPDVMSYASMLSNEGYTDYNTKKVNKVEKKDPDKRPYVISPDEFGELADYSKISLMWYADQVLTDDMDQPVENVDDIVGFDAVNHFGEYDDDSVYVRNDARKCDYEILRSLRRYSEIIEEEPFKAEV